MCALFRVDFTSTLDGADATPSETIVVRADTELDAWVRVCDLAEPDSKLRHGGVTWPVDLAGEAEYAVSISELEVL